MKFYFREGEDGSCEVICTDCFQVVGIGIGSEQIQAVKDGHRCPAEPRMDALPGEAAAGDRTKGLHRLRAAVVSMAMRRPAASALGVVLLLYAIPTVLEWIALRSAGPWLGIVILGDVVGCVYIGLLCGRGDLAAVVYLTATAFEALAVETNAMSAGWLMWIADALPTAAALLLQRRLRAS